MGNFYVSIAFEMRKSMPQLVKKRKEQNSEKVEKTHFRDFFCDCFLGLV